MSNRESLTTLKCFQMFELILHTFIFFWRQKYDASCFKMPITQRQLRTTEEIEGTTSIRVPKESHFGWLCWARTQRTAHEENTREKRVLEVSLRILWGESVKREWSTESHAAEWSKKARKSIHWILNKEAIDDLGKRGCVVSWKEGVSARWETRDGKCGKLKKGEDSVKEVTGREKQGTRWISSHPLNMAPIYATSKEMEKHKEP